MLTTSERSNVVAYRFLARCADRSQLRLACKVATRSGHYQGCAVLRVGIYQDEALRCVPPGLRVPELDRALRRAYRIADEKLAP